jgi:HK97 family phage prohead protease/HK97 family phage major capsid protein
MTLVRKVTVAKAAGNDLEFVLSDATKDRMGDVIEPKGWDLSNFKKNPIALFNHDSKFPIGTWKNVRVEKNRLVGQLELAKQGTSDRIDEIIRLVEQDILRAVSVGFSPIEAEPLKDNSGLLFKKQELLETSLVSVPANPSAVQLARSLNTSDEVIDLVFGEHASAREAVIRGVTGKLAETQSNRKNANMTPLSKRIEDAQERLTALKDQLTKHLETIGDEPDDAALAVTDELNGKIANQQRSLDSLTEAEKQLAATTRTVVVDGEISNSRRPFAAAARKVAPADYVMRSLVAKVIGHATKQDPRIALIERYGEDGKIDDVTKAVFDVITRAASAPADTTTSGWASQLVQTAISEFMQLLIPASVYPGLAAKGLRLNFGRSGIISIPSRSATPTIAGSFVAQGSPIPVRQGAFGSVTLTPKKMAVISTFTREIAEHSTPAIEGLIRNAIQEDTSVALDSVLLDATAASTTRPAGLRNGVTVTTATTGGGFAALVGDIKALIGALITASNGNIRQPVFIMNPVNALSISLTQNAGGDFPFKQEISQNQLQGYPLIQSATVTAGMIILVDAADFVSVEGDAPRFDMSDQATLHMEDTTPLAIGTAGAPNTVAAPVRSLYQTDSMALRMIMDVNWAMRRTGVIAWTQSVTW